MVIGSHKKGKYNFARSRHRRYRRGRIYAGQELSTRVSISLSPVVWKYLFFIALASLLVYFFFFSSFFAVKDVFVEGNNYIKTEDIVALVHPGQNIFRFDPNQTKNKLQAEFPEIKDLVIYRGIPNAIKIVVLEREGRFVWQSGDDRYLVSYQGEVAKKMASDEQADNKYIIVDKKALPVKVGDKVVSPSFISFANNVYDQFFTMTNIKPTTFEVEETTFDLILHTEAGFYVKFNTMRSSKNQLENLKRVLVAKRDEVKEYVDLRIDGWAYYK